MINRDIKDSLIYHESLEDEKNLDFEYKSKKFIHDIDNVYFSLSIQNDSKDNEDIKQMIDDLKSKKEIAKATNKDCQLLGFTDLYITIKSFSIYTVCITCPDRYDIFIAEYLPNENTPRILVQIRSMPLWLEGYRKIIKEVMDKVKLFLDYFYKLSCVNMKETRIDYAFHTNYIQNSLKYLGDEYLMENLNFNGLYSKVGQFNKSHGDCTMSIDYLSLGSRKANNVFFRIYNKSREVIEKGYKSFFIDIWEEKKMISNFDSWCYRYAYVKKSYGSLQEARLKYYIEFGNDLDLKIKLHNMIENRVPYKEMELIANGIVPKVNLIFNIEFETKRKFYRTCDDFISMLDGSELRVVKLLDNRKFFIDYLTSYFVWFGEYYDEEKHFVDWWKRLRRVKFNGDTKKLVRDYSTDVNKERIINGVLRSLASLAVIEDVKAFDIDTDLDTFMNNINDNHKSNYIDIKEKKHIYYQNKQKNRPKS